MMKVQAKIQKWGNGLAIRIAGVVRDIPDFKEGMPIEIEVSGDGLEIRKMKPKNKHLLLLSESELLKGMTPQTAHAEIIPKLLEDEY